MNPIWLKQVLLEQACKFAHLESTAIFILFYYLYKSCAFKYSYTSDDTSYEQETNTDLFEHLCNILMTFKVYLNVTNT